MYNPKAYNQLLEKILSIDLTSQPVLVVCRSEKDASLSLLRNHPDVDVISFESVPSLKSFFVENRDSRENQYLNFPADKLPQTKEKYAVIIILQGGMNWKLDSFAWMKLFNLLRVKGNIYFLTFCSSRDRNLMISPLRSLRLGTLEHRLFWELPIFGCYLPIPKIFKNQPSFIKYWNSFRVRKTKTYTQITRERIFPYAQEQKNAFEKRYKSMLDTHNRWLSENPEYVFDSAEPLKEKSYENANILVLSPHPDDEIIGCGGTLLKLLKVNANINIIQLTDGASSSSLNDYPRALKEKIRIHEAEKVAEEMNIKNLQCWGISDQSLNCSQETVTRLRETLLAVKPDIVFVPFINDPHKDHKMTNFLLQKALQAIPDEWGSLKVLSYEVWSKVPCNLYCRIEEQIDIIFDLLFTYETAMKSVNYIERIAQMHAYAAFEKTKKEGFIEPFLELDVKNYLQLICKEQER